MFRTDDDGFVDNFRARLLHDAWLDAQRIYWQRRARRLEAALPRAGDFLGASTPVQRAERAERVRGAASACRARATGADGYAIGTLVESLDDVAEGEVVA